MLMKTPTPKPVTATSFAFARNYAVRLATGIKCPHCGRELRATDITVDDFAGTTKIVCQSCHQDALVIEATS
jgi:transcription elongation factor Elf1